MNSFNTSITYLPPPGYGPPLPPSIASIADNDPPPPYEEVQQERQGQQLVDRHQRYNYVDDEGMHRIYTFDGYYSPPRGIEAVRKWLLDIAHSQDETECDECQPIAEGSLHAASLLRPCGEQHDLSNSSMTFGSSQHASLSSRSYDEFYSLMRYRLQYEAVLNPRPPKGYVALFPLGF